MSASRASKRSAKGSSSAATMRAKSEPIADRTLELKRSDFAIAVASAKIEAEERAAENAYIDVCVSSGNVEALFYALLRKRDRLVRSVDGVGVRATAASRAKASAVEVVKA